jgi:hypothetical protein
MIISIVKGSSEFFLIISDLIAGLRIVSRKVFKRSVMAYLLILSLNLNAEADVNKKQTQDTCSKQLEQNISRIRISGAVTKPSLGKGLTIQ